MTRSGAVLAVLSLLTALLQLGAMPTLFLGGVAAPLLPVALIAEWATARGEREAWAAVLIASIVLGVASQERVGWFLLALLPTAALSTLALGIFAARSTAARRLASAPVVAAGGTLLYLAVLALASGRVAALGQQLSAGIAAAAWTALVASLIALVLWPLQLRTSRGLFE